MPERIILAGVVGAAIACGSPNPRSSAGTHIDSTGRYPVAFAVSPKSRPVAELLFEIGGAAASGAELGSARSVLLGRGGRLIVVDPSYRAVFEFDSTGNLLRQLGREGAGPAEYRRPYSVAWFHDTLALLDPGNSRIGLFDSTGRWAGSWPVAPITGGQFIRLYRTAPDAWAYASRATPSGREGVFVRYSSTGPSDTISILRPPPDLGQSRTCARPDGAISFFQAPFGPTLMVIPVGDGTQAAAITSAYAIAFVAPNRDTTLVVRRALSPVAVADDEWKAANDEWAAFRREWPTATCDRGEFSRPSVKPLIRSLFRDNDGRLWVEAEGPEGLLYDVFDRSGRLEATVTGLPPSTGVDPSVLDGRIAMIGEDPTGAPVVRVFRLEAGPRTPASGSPTH